VIWITNGRIIFSNIIYGYFYEGYIYQDPITQKSYRPAKKVPQHIVVFGEEVWTYVLHAQEEVSEAIRTESPETVKILGSICASVNAV
jgi:hypothetical protein